MKTANTKICVKNGIISMKENGEKITFKVFKESQLPMMSVKYCIFGALNLYLLIL
jgi:hypothetical protein